MTIALGQNTYPGQDIFRPDGFKISVLTLLVCTLAINILSLALPVMTLQVYDRILPNPGSGTLPVLIAGVCTAIILEAILRICRSYTIGWSGAAYEHRLSCKAINHILCTDPLHIGAQGIGEHINRMGAIGKLKDFYNGYSLTVLMELMFVPLYLGLIIYIAPPLAFVPAIILAIFTFVSLYQGRKLKQKLKARDQTDDTRFSFLIEALEGIHSLKAFGLEKFFERRYELLEEESCLKNFDVTMQTSSTFNISTIFSNLMIISVISIGAYFALLGQLTTGALIATLLLSGRLMQPVQRTLVLWTKYQDFSLAKEKLGTIFHSPVQNITKTDDIPERKGTLDTQNLTFRLSENAPYLIQNINLNIRSNETILISGDHGAGKTILLNLISGIYMPSSGNIFIDGKNSTNFPPEILTQHVGYIRTNSLIFRGTIRDNITCFGQTDEKSARSIAALLKVDKEIAKLPSGFDTFLSGTNTDNISPGLKQRIAMTRVLAPKPHLILFDNADRALDSEGYELIYSFIARLQGKATFIMVTEDNNLRQLAQRHFTLSNGHLTQAKIETYRTNIQSYKDIKK